MNVVPVWQSCSDTKPEQISECVTTGGAGCEPERFSTAKYSWIFAERSRLQIDYVAYRHKFMISAFARPMASLDSPITQVIVDHSELAAIGAKFIELAKQDHG